MARIDDRIPKELRMQRAALQLSKTQMANEIGISPRLYGQLETGERTKTQPAVIQKIYTWLLFNNLKYS